MCIFSFSHRVGQATRGFSSESSMLEHLWSKVNIEPLAKDELKEVHSQHSEPAVPIVHTCEQH